MNLSAVKIFDKTYLLDEIHNTNTEPVLEDKYNIMTQFGDIPSIVLFNGIEDTKNIEIISDTKEYTDLFTLYHLYIMMQTRNRRNSDLSIAHYDNANIVVHKSSIDSNTLSIFIADKKQTIYMNSVVIM